MPSPTQSLFRSARRSRPIPAADTPPGSPAQLPVLTRHLVFQIFYQDEHFPIRRTDKVANCRTKRNNDFPTIQYGKRGDQR